METSEAPSRPPAKQEGAAAASRQLSSLIARFPLPVVQRIRARQRSPGQAGTELPPLWARYCGMQVAPAPPRHPPSSSRQPALLGQLPPAHVIELGAGRGYLVVVRGSRQPAAAPASGATPPSRARLVAAAALALRHLLLQWRQQQSSEQQQSREQQQEAHKRRALSKAAARPAKRHCRGAGSSSGGCWSLHARKWPAKGITAAIHQWGP